MLCPRCHRIYEAAETRCAYDGETLTSERRIDFVRAGRTRHAGAVLGQRFKIRGFMGQGGTSRVYLAEDTNNQEPVAVKLLEPPWAHDRVARERFLQEARAASSIDHPGVVKIHFVGQRSDGTPYIAMEYLFGESLMTYLERVKIAEPDVGLPILRELATALGAAHDKGVIHRDVKPQNVFLVGEPGEPYGVKLVDFGFAKLRDSTITAAGTAIGSVGYMSPEQCVSDDVDPRTDVYGLGVVAFRMFSGALPFGEEPTDEVLAKHLVDPAPRLSDLREGADPGLVAVVAKCLHKDPIRRYPTMAELGADLDALGDGRPPKALDDAEVDGERYSPRGPFSRLVARALYRRIGRVLPNDLA